MAATASWQPQENGFNEICGLLEQQISPSSNADKSQIWQQLQQYSQFPDFNNYLAFILARAEVLLASLLFCAFDSLFFAIWLFGYSWGWLDWIGLDRLLL